MQDESPWSGKEMLHLSSVREVFGGFAHEVSQPLNAIMIASQVIQLKIERSPLSQDEKSFLNQRLAIVATQVQRVTQIVDELRQFVAGRTNYGGPVDLARIYERIRGFMDQQFMGRGIELRVESAQGLPLLQTDPHLAETVLVYCLAFARDSLEAIGQSYESQGVPHQKLVSVSLLTDHGMSLLRVQWGVGKNLERDFNIDPESRVGLVAARSVLRSEGGDLRTTPSSVTAAIP